MKKNKIIRIFLLIGAAVYVMGTVARADTKDVSSVRLVTSRTISSGRVSAVEDAYEKVKTDLDSHSFESDITFRERKPMPLAAKKAVAILYREGGVDSPSILKNMLKTKGKLSSDHGKVMWEARNEWLMTSVEKVCKEHKLSLGLLDSGTEGSVANDTDKTLKILRQELNLSEEDVIRLVEGKLTKVIHEETGVDGIGFKALDIELFSGKNLYSSAFTAKAPAVYKKELNKVMAELSKNEYAYLTDGSIKSQVIMRAVEKEENLKKGMMAVGSAFDMFEYDPSTGKVVRSRPDDWIDILRLSKDFSPQDAWGAAIGNHLMLMHKLSKIDPRFAGSMSDADRAKNFDKIQDDVAKYLMRAVMDTQSVKEAIKNKSVKDSVEDQPFKRYDMSDFQTETKQRALVGDLTGFSPDHACADEYRLALTVAADILENKKKRAEGDPVKPDNDVYGVLVAYLKAKSPGTDLSSDQWLAKAKMAFSQVSEEMSMRIMEKQFPDAVTVWLKPGKNILKNGKDRNGRFKNENIRILSMVQLAGAYKQLNKRPALDVKGMTQWEKMVRSVPDEFKVDLENLSRMMDWEQKQIKTVLALKEKMLQGRWQALGPDTAGSRLKLEARDTWNQTLQRVEHARAGLQGVVDGLDLKTIYHTLKDTGKSVAFDQLTDFMGKTDAVFSILGAYQASEGMPENERQKILYQAVMNEIIGEIPVAGEVHGMYQSGGDGKQQIELATLLWERVASNMFNYSPSAAPIVFYINFATQFVNIIGHEIFYPLRKDYMDIVFKGFLEPSEEGILRAGRKVPNGFKPTAYPGILSRVPVKFAILHGDLIYKLMNDEKTPDNVVIALGKEAQASGEQFVAIVDLETDYKKKLAALKERIHYLKPDSTGIAAGQFQEDFANGLAEVARTWERQARIADFVKAKMGTDAGFFFEIHRQNAYRYFKDRVQTQFSVLAGYMTDVETLYAEYNTELVKLRQQLWSVRGRTLNDVQQQRQALESMQKGFEGELAAVVQKERTAAQTVFLDYVRDWVEATGDFADADENLAMKFVWHDEKTREGIAQRMSDAFLGSRDPTLAAEAAIHMIRKMETLVGERARQNYSRNLTILYEKALPQLPDITPYTDALAPEVENKPQVVIHAVTIQKRDKDELQIEVSVSGRRQNPEDEWVIKGPVMLKKIPSSAVPKEQRQGPGLTGKEDSVYEITLQVVNTRDNSLVAEGRTFLGARKEKFPEPEPKPPEREGQEKKDLFWNLKKIILVHQPQGFPYEDESSAYVKTRHQLEIMADHTGVHIKGRIDGKHWVRDCPDHPEVKLWGKVFVHEDFHVGLFPGSIRVNPRYVNENPMIFDTHEEACLWKYTVHRDKSVPDYTGKCKETEWPGIAGNIFFELHNKVPVISIPGIKDPVKLPRDYQQRSVSGRHIDEEEGLSFQQDKETKDQVPSMFGLPPATDKYRQPAKYDFSEILKDSYEKTWFLNQKRPTQIAARFIITADVGFSVKDKKIIFDVVYGLEGEKNESAAPEIIGFGKNIESSGFPNASESEQDTTLGGGSGAGSDVRTWGDAQDQANQHRLGSGESGDSGGPQTWQEAQETANQGLNNAPATWQMAENQARDRNGDTGAVTDDETDRDNNDAYAGHPWDNPDIQQHMDDWFSRAIPVIAAERPGQWGFTKWGQVTGPGITIAGPPDHPSGWSRHQSLWAVRDKFDSLNLCSLGEYVRRRLNHQDTADCQKSIALPKPAKKPGIFDLVSRIPDAEWLTSRPGRIKDRVFVYFSNNPSELIRCGRQVLKKGISFIGLTQAPEKKVQSVIKSTDRDIPIASGKNTYVIAYQMARHLSKTHGIDFNSVQGVLLDEKGGLIRSGSCESITGVQSSLKKKGKKR